MAVTLPDNASVEILAATVGTEVEICAPDGRLLGRFTPAPRPGMEFPELGMSVEDMNRRLNDPNAKWVTGEEVMARLRLQVPFHVDEAARLVRVVDLVPYGR